MNAPAALAPAIPDILEEHLEELGFLAIQRRKKIVDPDTSIARLAEHDERHLAHRDGLRIAGATAGRIARAKLDEAALDWHVSAAARVWIEEAAPPPEAVVERIEAGGAELAAGWREAFRRMKVTTVDRIFPRAGADPPGPLAQFVRIDARIWHGRFTESDLTRFAADSDPQRRGCVARCLARSASVESDAIRATLERLLQDDDVLVRRAALWSFALVDRDAGLGRARQTTDSFAFRVLGLLGPSTDAPRLRKHAQDAAALRALGELGNVEHADFLAERLQSSDPVLAEAAAEALLTLFGFPENTPALWPADPAVARARFEEMREQLDVDGRWLRGRPFPYDGGALQESTESRWRTLVQTPGSTDPWRAEVPDGFFTALPNLEALCGE